MPPFLVTIDKVSDYNLADIEGAVSRIFANYPEFVKKIRGSRILIKPNLLYPDPPERLTCTHPVVVEAVIRFIQEHGGRPALGDRPVRGGANKVARAVGISDVCEKYDVPIVEFKNYREITFPKAGRFSTLGICCELDEYDMIVNLPKLKVHSQLVLTCAVKNLFGCVRLSHRILTHIGTQDREVFAELLVRAAQSVRPTFNLVDGVIAMQNEGPRGGTPYKTGVLLGGEDPYCVDAAVAKILDMKAESIPILKVARRLGIFDPGQLIFTSDILYPDFKLPRLQPVSFTLYRSGRIFFRQFILARFRRKHNDDIK